MKKNKQGDAKHADLFRNDRRHTANNRDFLRRQARAVGTENLQTVPAVCFPQYSRLGLAAKKLKSRAAIRAYAAFGGHLI
jgi:hypothetical protein